MYKGKLIFAQITDHLPLPIFRRCVARYDGDRYVKTFRCMDQYLTMFFAQLTFRESLRDVEACLRAQENKLYHMGIRSKISPSTLSDANEERDWRIYAEFAQELIYIARPLYVDTDLGLDLDNTIYALDSSTVDLCMSVFPWALFRTTKSAVKLHTLLDLRGNIPSFIHISDGKMHDVKVLDILTPEAGAFYIMDRAYVDFKRLYTLHLAGAFFVTRTKSNTKYKRRYSNPCDKENGIKWDQTVVLTGVKSAKDYPHPLRRVRYYDEKTGKTLDFLTNNFAIPAKTVADLYKNRWQVELFFKWIKQHLRIKAFFWTTENAVKTQIWIAISVYMLITIIKKRLQIPLEIYTILQILSLTLFEKTPIYQVLSAATYKADDQVEDRQLKLFDY